MVERTAHGSGDTAADRATRSHRSLLRSCGAAAFVSLLLGASCSGSPAVPGRDPVHGSAAPGSAAGAPAVRDATAADVLGAVRSARGDVVLVNVWATWCDPCRKEFPALMRAQRELSAKGFRLILVSADFPDQRAKVVEFLSQQGVGFPTFLKAEDDMAFIDALDRRWSGALPASFLFGRNGQLHDFWEGETSYDVLNGRVLALLGKASAPDAGGGSR